MQAKCSKQGYKGVKLGVSFGFLEVGIVAKSKSCSIQWKRELLCDTTKTYDTRKELNEFHHWEYLQVLLVCMKEDK